MSYQQCPAALADGGLQCVLDEGHGGAHGAWRASTGRLTFWHNNPGAALVTVTAATFDELVGHLEDLIALALAEGFGEFAARLAHVRIEIVCDRPKYGARVDTPPPPASLFSR